MKNLCMLGLLIGSLLFISTDLAYGQNKKVVVVHKGHGHHHHAKAHKNVVVVHKSKYRPKKVVVFHPVWGPKRNFNHRWVYFPKYHLYWDNWRNVYFYRNGNAWVYNKNKPTIVVNVNLDNEKHYELNESNDDNDDVYNLNSSHESEFPE